VVEEIEDTGHLELAGMAYQGTQLSHGGLGVVIGPPLQLPETFALAPKTPATREASPLAPAAIPINAAVVLTPDQ
jgi:hypothetical protein